MSVIVANWKMNMSLLSGASLVRKIMDFVYREQIKETVVVCPPFTMLDRFSSLLHGTSIGLGAQNLSVEPEGARTGEVSAGMVKDSGCEYVILGHSERRAYHDETDPIIRRKVELAHMMDLKTIICIGETAEERKNGATLEVIKDQLLRVIPDDAMVGDNILISYEPIWSIGTGIIPSTNEINEIGEYCAGIFATRFSFEKRIKFLYGGSVNASNCADILDSKYVDGVLVGGASLSFKSFSEILKTANEVCKQYS